MGDIVNSLVTGGAGFIGSHVVDGLLRAGHEVVVIDDESGQASDKFNWNKSAFNIVEDVTNMSEMKNVFNNHNFDYVFHLAAKTKIVPAMENPPPTLYENYTGLLNILELSRIHSIKRVVFSSSSSVYGDQEIPYPESAIPDCLNPYALSKLHGESLCKHYSDIFDLDTVCLRYFNVFGERMPERGQYAPVIAIFLRQLRNGKPLTIVGDGHQRRDFVYVKDVATANINAALRLEDFSANVYNVGHGSMVSVMQIAELISSEYIHLPERPGDARNTLADTSLVRKDLSWAPTIDAITWLKESLSK
jgi:UDP-glucose 4-epimerase